MAKDFNPKLYFERLEYFTEALTILNNAHQEDALEVASFEQTENAHTGETMYGVDVYNKKYAVRFYLLEDDFNLEPGHFADFENFENNLFLLNKFKNKELVIARIMTLISKIVKVSKKLFDPYRYANSGDNRFYNRIRLASDKGPDTTWLGQPESL